VKQEPTEIIQLLLDACDASDRPIDPRDAEVVATILQNDPPARPITSEDFDENSGAPTSLIALESPTLYRELLRLYAIARAKNLAEYALYEQPHAEDLAEISAALLSEDPHGETLGVRDIEELDPDDIRDHLARSECRRDSLPPQVGRLIPAPILLASA
jgi:hypothetical protein